MNTTPLQRVGQPDDITDVALFLISDASRHITGEVMTVDAGAYPGFAPPKA